MAGGSDSRPDAHDQVEEHEEPHIRLVFGRETLSGGSPKARIIIEEATGNTSLSSVFTLSNSAIGAGVLSLPFAFFKAGMFDGAIHLVSAPRVIGSYGGDALCCIHQ